jgi:NAD dependent epimerase/dehydratase family enzyme
MGWVHIVDTVRALEHAVDGDLDGPFNVTAPEPVTMDTFSAALARALGKPAVVRVPAFAVRLMFGDRAEAMLTGQRAIPHRLDQRGFSFVFPDLASALADLVSAGK